MTQQHLARPYVVVVLAMSADGKIADIHHSAARFPSSADKAHLEAQVARADAALFGAGTLRAYGTTLPVSNPHLIDERRQRQQSDQPFQIVCSASGCLDWRWHFFDQFIPRWLITTPAGKKVWQAGMPRAANRVFFEQILVSQEPLNWPKIMDELLIPTTARPPIGHLTVMGGGELVASLLHHRLVDELYLTVCPLLIGGKAAPTPVEGIGFTLPDVPRLKLQSAQVEGDEVFLHYDVGV
ncbi:MAG: RibD family protein [Phormidesmis sp.]